MGLYYLGFGFHSFRREAVTALAQEIGSPQTMNAAGHSKAGMTMLTPSTRLTSKPLESGTSSSGFARRSGVSFRQGCVKVGDIGSRNQDYRRCEGRLLGFVYVVRMESISSP
ncbi:MAG: hypothetical protein WBE37_02365, partial [Bryobacteraceae bacterium]